MKTPRWSLHVLVSGAPDELPGVPRRAVAALAGWRRPARVFRKCAMVACSGRLQSTSHTPPWFGDTSRGGVVSAHPESASRERIRHFVPRKCSPLYSTSSSVVPSWAKSNAKSYSWPERIVSRKPRCMSRQEVISSSLMSWPERPIHTAL